MEIMTESTVKIKAPAAFLIRLFSVDLLLICDAMHISLSNYFVAHFTADQAGCIFCAHNKQKILFNLFFITSFLLRKAADIGIDCGGQ